MILYITLIHFQKKTWCIYMINYMQRQSGATWYPILKGLEVIIVGAGGLGSFISLSVSRLGCDITLFDYDNYESHNLTGQLVSHNQVGMNKANAIKDTISMFTPSCNLDAIPEKYTSDSITGPIVIVGPDNNEARKIAFDNWVSVNWETPNAIFLDARSGWDVIEIFCVTKKDADWYYNTLLASDSYAEESCSTKQTTYCVQMAASFIANYLKNHISYVNGIGAYDVPRYTNYNLTLMELSNDLEY